MSLNLTDKLIKFPLELGTIKYLLKRHLATIERIRATISLKKLVEPCSNTLNLVITLCWCRLHSCGLSLNVGNSSFHLTERFMVNNGCIKILFNTHLREHQQYVIIYNWISIYLLLRCRGRHVLDSEPNQICAVSLDEVDILCPWLEVWTIDFDDSSLYVKVFLKAPFFLCGLKCLSQLLFCHVMVESSIQGGKDFTSVKYCLETGALKFIHVWNKKMS